MTEEDPPGTWRKEDGVGVGPRWVLRGSQPSWWASSRLRPEGQGSDERGRVHAGMHVWTDVRVHIGGLLACTRACVHTGCVGGTRGSVCTRVGTWLCLQVYVHVEEGDTPSRRNQASSCWEVWGPVPGASTPERPGWGGVTGRLWPRAGGV